MQGENGGKEMKRVNSSILKNKEDKHPEETVKLKKIIEKSYFSIR